MKEEHRLIKEKNKFAFDFLKCLNQLENRCTVLKMNLQKSRKNVNQSIYHLKGFLWAYMAVQTCPVLVLTADFTKSVLHENVDPSFLPKG